MQHKSDKYPHAHNVLPSDPALRVKALETLLTNKGLIDPATLDAIIEIYENKIGPKNGASVVARAWSDPKFYKSLFSNATETVADMGFYGRQGEHITALQNSSAVHNIVVCSLCSCYPWPLLGIPPSWYKSDAYRARTVREPRKVLAEFGITLQIGTSIQVWDSTAEMRYIVIPERPNGTDGWSVEKLSALVTRDSMIGTGFPKGAI